MCHEPFNLTAEECELRERARDAETERMESAVKDISGLPIVRDKRYWKP